MSRKVNLAFTSVIHRHNTDIADECTRRIANKHGLSYSKYLSEFAVLSLNRLPLSQLIIANNVIVWLWILDKLVDSGDGNTSLQEMNHIVDVLQGRTVPQTPIACMIADKEFWGEYYNVNTVNAIIDMIEYGMKAKVQMLNREFTLDEYVNVRMYDSGCFVLLSLVPTNDNTIPIANVVMWMINDIYSYNLDMKENGRFNYITQVAIHYNISIDSARNIANKLIHKFSNMIHDDNLKSCCYGCLLWHDNSPRYK